MQHNDPRESGKAIALAVTRLAKIAAKHGRASEEVRKEGERALTTFGRCGLRGPAAIELLKAICEATPVCQKCGARHCEMSGIICLDCAIGIRNEAQHQEWSESNGR